jgi:hypothetical protein
MTKHSMHNEQKKCKLMAHAPEIIEIKDLNVQFNKTEKHLRL